MSLFSELIKKRSSRGHTGFWDSKYGPFSQINQIDFCAQLTPGMLKELQVMHLKMGEKTNARIQEANKFIEALPTYQMSETEEMAANAIFSRIATILNSPFGSGDVSTRLFANKAQELNTLLKTINVNMPISSSMLDVLNSTSRLFKADDRFYTYKKEKSDFYEALVQNYINSLLGGSGAAVNTGPWVKQSDFNRQMITDFMVFTDLSKQVSGRYAAYDKNDVEMIGHNVKISDNLYVSVNSNLGSLLNTLSKLSGKSSVNFSLDDELADTLDTLSSLRGQVKSGINQNIINSNTRTELPLSTFNDAKLNLLYSLYSLDASQNFIYFYKNPKNSPTLSAYANYLLAKNIHKTTLFTANDIYFTEKGFETALSWLTRKNLYLKFNRGIKMDASLLTQQRRYGFKSI